MIKNLFFKSILFFSICYSWGAAAQPANYYDVAVGKKGEALKSALSTAIYTTGSVSYNGLWTLYKTSDARADGKVWDIYSEITDYTFGNDQCGTYKVEGDCYNREHTVPQSWFGKASPMVSDAWHVVPSDGKINGVRSNYPFGEVGNATTTSANNHSKLGNCITPGYSGIVFEPNDEYKGDIARMYFYMATRYENSVGSWSGGVFKSSFPNMEKWVVDLMIRWHRQDPVSQKEKVRNEAIYKSSQRNRNPYVDYPELAELIFGNRQNEAFNPNGGDGGVTDPEPEIPSEPSEPEEVFEALEATEVKSNEFTARWNAHKEATDYRIEVYRKRTEAGEATTLFDIDLTNKDNTETYGSQNYCVPRGWSTPAASNYTAYESNAIRMGSAKQGGKLTSPALQASGTGTLTIVSKKYGSDTPTLSVYLDNTLVSTLNYESSQLQEDVVVLENITPGAVVNLVTEKGKRVYLSSLKLTAGGGVAKENVEGYPTNTGNTTSYRVTGLESSESYFYTIEPLGVTGAAQSKEIRVDTAEDTAIGEITELEDQILTFMDGYELNILNAPKGGVVTICDISGHLIRRMSCVEHEEKIRLDQKGIYILHIAHEKGNVSRKLVVR